MSTAAAEKWTPERRRQLTRTALIDAAAQVFARRGFNGASLEEIAETAGFTRGAIYSNFGNKDGLFLAVLERHNQAQLEAYAPLMDAAAWETSKGRADLAALWAHQASDLDTLRLWLEFKLYALRNPRQRRRLAAFERRWVETISRFITQQTARTGASLKLPASDLAEILFASNQGLQEHMAISSTGNSRLVERFMELLIDAAFEDRGLNAP